MADDYYIIRERVAYDRVRIVKNFRSPKDHPSDSPRDIKTLAVSQEQVIVIEDWRELTDIETTLIGGRVKEAPRKRGFSKGASEYEDDEA